MEFKALFVPRTVRCRDLTKMLRVMRLTTLIVLIACLHASARSVAQSVSFQGKDVPMLQVFLAIKQQTGYVVFYNVDDLKIAHPVTLDVKDVPLADFLDICLKDQPLRYSIENKTIFITLKASSPTGQPGDTTPPSKLSQVVQVHGTVFTESGETLSGANVTNMETQKGTITNARGEFSLSGVSINNTLIISFIGYAPQRIKIKDDANLKIYLKVAKNELDKVVIQAYGTTTNRLQTGDISTVTAAQIERQPVMNPLLALQGEVPGMTVTLNSGYASAPLVVDIRGQNSVNPSFPTDPLYIIDGVPLTVNEIGNSSSAQTGSTGFLQNNGLLGPAEGQSPLFSLSPEDIESISILKDADATAIYGSRGANGVVLITTKKGKAGKTKLDISAQQGENRITRFWQMLNTQQYLQVREEAFKNDGITPNISNAYDLISWDTTRYTDWQRFIMGDGGKVTNAELSLSGGDVRTTYRISGGYFRQTPINEVSGGDQRGHFLVNLSTKSANERLSATLAATYTIAQSNLIAMPGSPTMPPNAPAVYDSLGNLNYNGWGAGAGSYPFGTLKTPYSATTYFLNSNLLMNYELAKGLNVKTSLGYNNAVVNNNDFTTIASQNPARNPQGLAQFGNSFNRNWIIEPQATYDVVLGKGKLSTLLGGSLQNNTTESQYVLGFGYTSDELLHTISNAGSISGTDNYGQYKFASGFARINYNWKDEFIVDLTGRRDGSSKFGPDREYGNFGAVGGAWIFTQENWFAKHLPVLSFGKLRGSYGTTGNDGIGPYGYLSRWTSNGLQTYNGIAPVVPTQHVDSNYQWEVDKKLETAVELGFWKDKLTVTAAWYRNRCGNQLINYPLPSFTGFNSVDANLPALVQNTGWEFKAIAKVIDVKNFTWSLRGNISFNYNKLVAYPGLSESPFATSYVVGQPLNITRLLHYTGVDPQTGQYTFFDKNHDGVITANPGPTDDRYIHNLNPKFFGGFGTAFTYKGFQLDLLFNYINQIAPNDISQGLSPGTMSNQPVSLLGKEWKYPGDVASVARFTTQPQQSDAYFQQSDATYTSASYVRLHNVSLAYNLPTAYARKSGMQTATIYVRAQDLFVITSYRGIDPAVQNFGGYPPARVITAGLSLTF